MKEATEDVSVVDNVHCRRGWWHHRANRWHRADGCRRAGAVIVVPGRPRYVIRDGVRVRVDVGNRGRVGTRTTIRGGTSSGGGAKGSVQSGQKGSSGVTTGGSEGSSKAPAQKAPAQKAPAAEEKK